MASILDLMDEHDKAWNAHDAKKVASFYAEDCVYETPSTGVLKGRNAVKAAVDSMLSAFPDLKFEAKTKFASGNVSAAELFMTGTHKGPLPDGTPATGKSFSLKLCGIAECDGDLIKRATVYYDTAVFAKQLGLTPPAPK